MQQKVSQIRKLQPERVFLLWRWTEQEHAAIQARALLFSRENTVLKEKVDKGDPLDGTLCVLSGR